jgi:molecular chaperone DnaK (HSP70)
LLTPAEWFRLLEECRIKKEALNPNSRRVSIELEHVKPDWGTVQIPVSDFYEEARPLMEETIDAAEELLRRSEEGRFEALYVTGGGSELPLVARVLRERFGRRVRRSAYTRSATAIGLAIQAGEPERYRLTDRLARYFGVWREADSGSRIVFDPLFAKGTNLPATGEPNLEIRRAYSPVHNVGHFRFLECSHRREDGTPSGEIMFWDEIRFPFDPALRDREDLSAVSVAYSPAAHSQSIQELYECDSSGSISVKISNESAGYSKTYKLGQWAKEQKPVKAARRGKAVNVAAHAE